MRSAVYCTLTFAIAFATSAVQADSTPGDSIRTSAAIAHTTAFKVDPLEAMHAPILRPASGRPLATDAELDLLLDANDGRVEHWSMAKAALVICGVNDVERQKHYLIQLKKIEVNCKKATASSKSAAAKARALGAYLLKEPMHAGYQSLQSDLAVLLDTGNFNCVSSAVLYNMMASRVGLQVRTVSISGHVYSRALDFDIEPTSGKVYPLDDRKGRARRMESKQENPLAPYNHPLCRETNNAGLLSEIYNNNANALGREQRFEEAVAAYLKGACLDPGNFGLVFNLRITFGQWIAYCNDNHDMAKAAAVENFANEVLRPIEQDLPSTPAQVARR